VGETLCIGLARFGQNRIHMPHMTVYLIKTISAKSTVYTPYIYLLFIYLYMVLANPNRCTMHHAWTRGGLGFFQSTIRKGEGTYLAVLQSEQAQRYNRSYTIGNRDTMYTHPKMDGRKLTRDGSYGPQIRSIR